MPILNSIFTTKSFWELYLLLESEELDEDDVEEQLNILKRNFTVREDIIEYEFKNQKRTATNKVAEFIFDCGDNYSLLIEYTPSPSGGEKSLYLKENLGDQKYQLGWWDLARWHPFCLKLDELDLLLEYWKKFDSNWADESIPILLLCHFIGVDNIETAENLVARVKNAFKALEVPSLRMDLADAIYNFVKSENYRWELDSELGWLFTSDEYACYSIRNKCHQGSDEGSFPFKKFAQMISEIRQKLSN